MTSRRERKKRLPPWWLLWSGILLLGLILGIGLARLLTSQLRTTGSPPLLLDAANPEEKSWPEESRLTEADNDSGGDLLSVNTVPLSVLKEYRMHARERWSEDPSRQSQEVRRQLSAYRLRQLQEKTRLP